jgi:hypothetical protein
MESTIISGFPGIGKSFLSIWKGDAVLDLDSGNFLGDNKWQLYKQALIDGIGKYEYILVSTHDETRIILNELNAPYFIIFPDKSLKKEYIQRYKERGNNGSFIKLMEEYFEDFVNSIENSKGGVKIKLDKPDMFLKDILYLIR